MPSEQIKQTNALLLEKLSLYLNYAPDFITPELMNDMRGGGLGEEEAFSALLAAALGIDTAGDPVGRRLYRMYFPYMLNRLDQAVYKADSYYKTIKLAEKSRGGWTLKNGFYKPYQLFVSDDIEIMPDGRAIPRLGFFSERFDYPEALENGREWMSVTPNEVNTMKADIAAVSGRVLTYGLGLGYFVYMASEKENVSSVTAVELNENAIELFNEVILPQLPNRDKVKIIKADAFDYAEHEMAAGRYDYVYTDIWHDPSDGIPLYKRMKNQERLSPDSKFLYWAKPTIRYYLGEKRNEVKGER